MENSGGKKPWHLPNNRRERILKEQDNIYVDIVYL